MNKKSYTQIFFKEEQRFRQWWVLVIVLASSALPWIGLFYQVILGHKFGNKPAPDYLMIIIWLAFGIGFPLLFLSFKLITEVREDGIYIKFFPFHRKFKFFSFDEIESFKEREYRPIYEYGGWGIRYGRKGMAYNVYGNKGIQLTMKNKKNILVGSQKTYEFYKAIRKLKP
ncbi:MAG: DUF6141 family protein [Ignavibacteriaceae bacterium]|jgi:hypothetical protein|nr:DUF6141 family protein [Ignavibacteriaceae bacterium]